MSSEIVDGLAEKMKLEAAGLITNVLFEHPFMTSGGFGSPIELALAVSTDVLTRLIWGHGIVSASHDWTYARCMEFTEGRVESGFRFRMFSQVTITQYRVDFLALSGGPTGEILGFVVECDGHEFHEKTKEQAERDKSRDRALLALGLPVMRFTGSEIWKSPFSCAGQVWDMMHDKAMESAGLRKAAGL